MAERVDRSKKADWNWSSYFAAKKQKLQIQFQEDKVELGENDSENKTKNLFQNIGIYVNGYTNPTAIELKGLMLKHGGFLYEYMCEKVTHIVASNLAHSKALILRNKLVVRPEWIVDSIEAKKLLPIESYQLVTSANDVKQNKLTDFINNSAKKLSNRGLKRKSTDFYGPITIDLIAEQEREEKSRDKLLKEKENFETAKQMYLSDYKCFCDRLNSFVLPGKVNLRQSQSELELERIKNMLDDWIFCTSRQNEIDMDDLQIFKSYLFYLLLILRDYEKLTFILKIFKYLIKKNGSFEWVESYKEIVSQIQSDFYERFNATLLLD